MRNAFCLGAVETPFPIAPPLRLLAAEFMQADDLAKSRNAFRRHHCRV